MRLHVLGIPVDDLSDAALDRALNGFLTSGHPHLVATPNPEMVMTARRDETFRAVLRRADLAPSDGFGLKLATWWLTGHSPRRIPGPELLDRILAAANHRGARLFLFGGRPGVARSAARAIAARFPGLQIVGTESGSRSWGWRLPKRDLVHRIARTRPEVLVVALGAPRQEKWLAHHLWELPTVRIGIGVGGTLDYLADTARRAPQAFQALGLEWVWRVLRQPWRLPRILLAAVRFPWLAFWARFFPRLRPEW